MANHCSAAALFYLNQHERLQCFDLATGVAQWDIVLRPNSITGMQIYGNPVAAGNCLLIDGWRGYTHLHCLNADADIVWVYPHLHDYATPIPGPWGIALPCTRADVRAIAFLDLQTGETVRRVPIPGGVDQNDQGSSVVRYGDMLLATTRQGGVFALEPTHGEGWEQIGQHHTGIARLPVTLTGHSIIFLDSAGMISAIDLRRGRPAWSLSAHHAPWSCVPAVTIAGVGTVLGTSYGRLYLVDEDGEQQAAVTIGRRIISPMGLIGPRTVAFETKGAVVACRVNET